MIVTTEKVFMLPFNLDLSVMNNGDEYSEYYTAHNKEITDFSYLEPEV